MEIDLTPTPGRIVNYQEYDEGPVQAAVVAHLWDDGMVNLSVLQVDGNWSARTSVRHASQLPEGNRSARWSWPERK